MKKNILFLLVIIGLNAHAESVRIDEHKEAVKALSELNFFYKGRGMAISPNLVDVYNFAAKFGGPAGEKGPLHTRWGLNIVEGKVKGLFTVPYEGMNVGVLGCIACHSGKAAGQYIIGLGNKNMDTAQVGKDTSMLMKVWGTAPRLNPKFREVHERAVDFTTRLGSESMENLTQGLVSVALIRSWFFTSQNLTVPRDGYKGQVKVPALWGYEEKRKTGVFWDGEANGEQGGWAIAVELFAGQTVENVREYYPKVHAAEEALGKLLPPAYPFKIERLRVEKGEKLFVNTCMKCHGDHKRDLEGLPIYEAPKYIPWSVVKTDPERISVQTKEWYDAVASSALSDVMGYGMSNPQKYVAPKLWGIWARFPYLHNASVPTIYDLLSAPETRPKSFSLKDAGEREKFDEVKLGLIVSRFEIFSRRLYDTNRNGHSNQGHYFESFKTLTPENKLEIIEYLKTL